MDQDIEGLSDEAKDLGDSGRNLRRLISSLEISEGDFIELSSKDSAELVRVNVDLVKHARAIAVDGTDKTADEIAELQREVTHQKLLLDAVDVAVLTGATTAPAPSSARVFPIFPKGPLLPPRRADDYGQ